MNLHTIYLNSYHIRQVYQFLKMEKKECWNAFNVGKQSESSTIDMSEITSYYTDNDIINRRSIAIQNVICNYNIFKGIYQRNNTSKEFFITCLCSFDCKCYTHAQKPRLSLHMCMRKGELEWFYFGQSFLPQFKVEWRCDKCKK